MRTNPIPRTSSSKCAAGLVTRVKAGSGPFGAAASTLTAAETKVLALVTLAKTNKQIAADLGISPATVKRHMENVLRKLDLRNRVEAAIYGLSVNGCSDGIDSECALRMWHKDRGSAASTWAV